MAEGTEDPGTEAPRMRALGRWAVGSLVLVALAASEVSGLGTLAALPIAAITAYLAALCDGEVRTTVEKCQQPRHLRSTRHFGDAVDFLSLWSDLLTQLTACATCARVISAAMDYVSGGRTSDWLFGLQAHALGEPWPDVLGVVVIVVVTGLCMLGLENSSTFSSLLAIAVSSSIVFFVVLGIIHADVEFWKDDRFLPEGLIGMFTTASLCCFGFMDVFPENSKKEKCTHPKRRIFLIVIVQLATYSLLTMLFTLMSHFREVSGTAVPLVRVFEARDVSWARPAMAALTVLVVGVALLEFCPATHNHVASLASTQWAVLARPLAYRNDTTGSPVLAVFTAGSLAAILAFACPLSYLVRLLNAGPLLKHILQSLAVLYYRYQPEDDVEDFPVCSEVEYSRLNQGPSKAKFGRREMFRNKIKVGNWLLSKSFKKSKSSILNDKVNEKKTYKKTGTDPQEERECLLMGAYSPEPTDVPPSVVPQSESNLDLDTDSDSDANHQSTATVRSSDGEADEESSSTDIDAVVLEYKERLKVATTLTGSSSASVRLPSLASGRFVLGSSIGICLWSILASVGVLLGKISFVGIGLSGICMLTMMIASQPQILYKSEFNQDTSTKSDQRHYRMGKYFVPFVPVAAILINFLLIAMLMPEIWLGIVLWIGAGMILFLRCEQCFICWDCESSSPSAGLRERVHIRPPPRGSVVSTLLPGHRHLMHDRRFTHVDTILIAR